MIRRQRTAAIVERLIAVRDKSTRGDIAIAYAGKGPRAHCAGAFNGRHQMLAKDYTISV